MIIDGKGYWDMASATSAIGNLDLWCYGKLTNITERIVKLDEPYYMDGLSPSTYLSLVKRYDL